MSQENVWNEGGVKQGERGLGEGRDRQTYGWTITFDSNSSNAYEKQMACR